MVCLALGIKGGDGDSQNYKSAEQPKASIWVVKYKISLQIMAQGPTRVMITAIICDYCCHLFPVQCLLCLKHLEPVVVVVLWSGATHTLLVGRLALTQCL